MVNVWVSNDWCTFVWWGIQIISTLNEMLLKISHNPVVLYMVKKCGMHFDEKVTWRKLLCSKYIGIGCIPQGCGAGAQSILDGWKFEFRLHSPGIPSNHLEPSFDLLKVTEWKAQRWLWRQFTECQRDGQSHTRLDVRYPDLQEVHNLKNKTYWL